MTLLRRRQDNLVLLTRCPPFAGRRRRALRPIAASLDRLRLAEGTVLAREGSAVREVVVVLTGEVIACRTGGAPQRVGPGETIGSTELLRGGDHPATLIAGHDVEVLVVNGPAYRWAARRYELG